MLNLPEETTTRSHVSCRQLLRITQPQIYAEATMEQGCVMGESVTRTERHSRASRGRQPGNLTLLRPPWASIRGDVKEKGGRASEGNPKRFPFSSLDSYYCDLSLPPRPHTCDCTLSRFPLHTVILTDCHSSCSHFGLPPFRPPPPFSCVAVHKPT